MAGIISACFGLILLWMKKQRHPGKGAAVRYVNSVRWVLLNAGNLQSVFQNCLNLFLVARFGIYPKDWLGAGEAD